MKYFLPLFILLSSACSTTKVGSTWLDPTARDAGFSNVAVYVAAPVSINRGIYEEVIAKELRKTGVDAVASSKIRGLAGRINRQKAEQVLDKTEVDAVVTVFITGFTQERQRDRVAYSGWWTINDDLSSAYVQEYELVAHQHKYTDESNALLLESSLVDFKNRHLVWRMYTKTKDPEYRDVSSIMASRIAQELRSHGLIAAVEKSVR